MSDFGENGYRKINAENEACPLHEDAQGFWFWDETWADRIGPYPSLETAQAGLKAYGTYLTTGEVDPHALPPKV